MCKVLHFQKEKGSLFEQLCEAELFRETAYGKQGLCGGRGACGKCRVRFLTGAPLPSSADRKHFSAEELRLGYRLACTAKPMSDCEIEICFEKDALWITNGTERQEIVTWSEGLQPEKKTLGQVQSLFWAVDIGTTTVVMQLIDKITGDIIKTYPFLNPQRIYGTDVMSRIKYASEGGAEQLRVRLLEELEKGFGRGDMPEQEKLLKQTEAVIICGNTAMGHLLMGYPIEGLGKAPFTSFSLARTEFELFGHKAVLMPGISSFVGADIVSGIYACGMAEREELSLFIDLGTNGEIVLGNKEALWCTATAAGSAFEGEISARAMGTDIVALAFEMLEMGIMDETGLMAEPWFAKGWQSQDGKVIITQQDIRALQMAKAAICAGICVLLEKADAWEKVSCVYLAGGFGYYLDARKAVGIGLIPKRLQGKCKAVGNTSLAGAIKYGMETGSAQKVCDGPELLADEKLKNIIRISKPLNLALQEEFEERYIQAMTFREIT